MDKCNKCKGEGVVDVYTELGGRFLHGCKSCNGTGNRNHVVAQNSDICINCGHKGLSLDGCKGHKDKTMKHDEKKINELLYELGLGRASFAINLIKQYSEHMVQQERERNTQLVKDVAREIRQNLEGTVEFFDGIRVTEGSIIKAINQEEV
jgi:putative lipase involved disintegration of autophagic bodies